jgi:hypothetical protein
MEMTKNNILLYEKHGDVTQEAVNIDDDKKVFLRGVKIYRVIRPLEKGYEVLAEYDKESDRCDLSELVNYENYYMVSLDINPTTNEFEWNCVILEDGTEDNLVFAIKNGRKCTEEECKLIDEVFPEFKENAFRK